MKETDSMINGKLYAYQHGTGEELVAAWEYLRRNYGADTFTGKVYGRPPVIDGVIEDRKVTDGCWLFETVTPEGLTA